MRLRGMICFCTLAATAMFASAQTYTVLHVFHGPDGADPEASSVLLDSKGNVYSTTSWGGAAGYGTFYKIDTDQKESVLYSFTNGNDGALPGDLIVGSDGAFYGGTSMSGTAGGTTFRITPAGRFSTIYRFQGGAHASSPYPYAFLWSENALYGAGGVIYRLDKSGETDLFKSGGFVDSAGRLTAADSKGNFYGVGGGGDITGSGLIFKFDASGHYSVLHVFEGPDGSNPVSVTIDGAGNLYGTTSGGGPLGHGTVFELNTKGQLTTLYSFTGGADGGGPSAGVILDPRGDLFGTTYSGGILTGKCANLQGCGVVFALTYINNTWKEIVLHRFNGDDGAYPEANLTLDLSGGALYGTTWAGGDYSCSTFVQSIDGCGVVFRITP